MVFTAGGALRAAGGAGRSWGLQAVQVMGIVSLMESVVSPDSGPLIPCVPSEVPAVAPPKRKKGPPGRYVPVPVHNALKAEIAALRAAEAEREALAADVDGGEITAVAMRKVAGQNPVSDTGPTERLLRAWLERDVKGFEARMRELAAEERNSAAQEEELDRLRLEVAELRGKQAEAGGRCAADDLVDSILSGAGPRS